jgi:FkbM family methyltransferase
MKVILRLKGGIGNQLFQQAFASTLCKRLDAELSVDTGYYSIDTYGRHAVILAQAGGMKRESVSQYSGIGCFVLNEGVIESVEQIKQLPSEVKCLVLDGYWQNEAFFERQAAIDLYGTIASLSFPLVESSQVFQQISCSRNSVSVHVRRSDYGHMGLCKSAYYKSALDHLADNYSDLELFFFTDEPNYTRHLAGQMGFSYRMVCSGDDLSDLYLMSLCKHHIVANSTFSWWGAWFGERFGGVIICPSDWVMIGGVKSPCPERWIRLRDAVEPFALLESDRQVFCAEVQRQRFASAIRSWFAEGGDFTRRVEFADINSQSVVFDLRGFKGDWSAEINSRYSPQLFIFEPILCYWRGICERFIGFDNVKCYNIALGPDDGEAVMHLSGDGTGEFAGGETAEKVLVRGIVGFLEEHQIEKIDLIKVNIEGGEYALLESLLCSGAVGRFKRVQVQFHDFVPDAIRRRALISEKLQRTHRQVWCYYFVWEEWVLLDA